MKKKLLIIEDEATLQKSLTEYLILEGFDVISALDGEEGIRMIKSEKPDLVLLDIILPKKDGYEVLAEARQDPEAKDVPIILLTNLGSSEDIEKAIEKGATTYLIKAEYKLEEVSAKIKEILKV